MAVYNYQEFRTVVESVTRDFAGWYRTDQTRELPVVDVRTVADILEASADLIERRGWIQNSMWNNYGFCAMGAIRTSVFSRMRDTTHLTLLEYQTVGYLETYMNDHGYLNDDYPDCLFMWNDAPGRTNFEVINLLRHAAKEWRNEHECNSSSTES